MPADRTPPARPKEVPRAYAIHNFFKYAFYRDSHIAAKNITHSP
jgi:hypothetical protein